MTKSEAAVKYLIRRLQTDGKLAYLICPCTETYALLTEAYAETNRRHVEEFRKEYEKTLSSEKVKVVWADKEEY